jgi:hypothetical protein
MSVVNPRPLSTLLSAITSGRERVSQKLAEEAVASVAADGLVTKAEADALEPFADGLYSARKEKAERAPGWTQGTEAGRALINSLATVVRDLSFEVNRDKKEPGFDWLGFVTRGWLKQDSGWDPAKTSAAQLLAEVREHSEGWVSSSVDRLLQAYPQALSDAGTGFQSVSPEVHARIEELTRKWVAGELPETARISDSLKAYLDSSSRV